MEHAEKDPIILGKPSLWAGIIVAPFIWLTQFLINYALVPYVCHTRKFFALHLTSAIALLLITIALIFCYRDWQEAGRQTPGLNDGGRVGTARLTAFVGLATCTLSLLITLLQGIAPFFIDPCTN